MFAKIFEFFRIPNIFEIEIKSILLALVFKLKLNDYCLKLIESTLIQNSILKKSLI